MAKLEIKKPKEYEGEFVGAGQYDIFVDGKRVTDILSKVIGVNLDMQQMERPLLTITCHVDDIDIDSDVNIEKENEQ